MLYRDHSYGKLTIESEVTDWILLDETEDYYANGQAGLVSVFHDALRFALDDLESRGFSFEDFDADGDGIIDSIAFLTSGYGAEWGSGTNIAWECLFHFGFGSCRLCTHSRLRCIQPFFIVVLFYGRG